jgi:hypothetical protein
MPRERPVSRWPLDTYEEKEAWDRLVAIARHLLDGIAEGDPARALDSINSDGSSEMNKIRASLANTVIKQAIAEAAALRNDAVNELN